MQLSKASILAIALAAAPSTASPVEKVVKLLTELKGRITEDGEKEQKIYDKYACWCEKTSARKADAIDTARASIRDLGQQILTLKGSAATLEAEIQTLLADIKDNEEAQATATTIRQKENAAYAAESAEMKQALEALERATKVLQGAMPSLLQNGAGAATAAARREAAASLQAVVAALPAVGSPGGVETLRQTALALAQDSAHYSPQSATIQGILQEMYKTFSVDLESKTSSEATSNKNYEKLMSTKQEELAQMQASVAKKETQKTEAEKMLAESMEAYDNTESQLKADVEFFDTTKAACTTKSDEWKQRSTLRKEELDGITQALSILSSDDARELFGKAIKPGHATLLQLDATVLARQSGRVDLSSAPSAKKQRAYEALKAKATGAHSLRLARMAATLSVAKVGHFDEVLKAIDTMMQTLRDEGAEDIKKRDQCKEQYQEIGRTIADVDWKIEKNDAKIAKLTALIEKKENEKTETINEIGETETHISSITTQREQENADFKQAKSDDEAAIALLNQAKDALAAYYKKNGMEALLQRQGPEFAVSADQAPEATFSGKGARHGESKGIMGILAVIIEDLEGEIRVSVADEATAQLMYEKALRAAQDLLQELKDKKISLETQIADRQQDKTDEGVLKDANVGNRTDTVTYRDNIKPDCDWIIGAFTKRANKRQAEMDGLTQAKEFLAGFQAQQSDGASSLAQRRVRGGVALRAD
eukprot:TRINITY_DN26112_c0_g1_i1.p1 TRINITY_DN26112_c0_g1~~TRINITY_DN26112_c0_g1_i1.p1  ORF type:complete len:745 (-),score=268.53 TRINITY_DN26112_c0_g1_i1:39-2177(-)